MIEQQGRVIRLMGNEAAVLIGRSSGCWLCDQGKGCGAGIFAQLLGRRTTLVQVENRIHARPGQLVGLEIPERVFLNMVLRLYLLPLLSALAGAALGHHVATMLQMNSGVVDLTSFLGAIVSFVAALVLSRPDCLKLKSELSIAVHRAKDPQSDTPACPSTIDRDEFTAR